MLSYVWPIALIVLSNVVYQVCTKSVPEGMNPFASLTVTYLVAALASAVLFFTLGRGGNIFAEYKKINFAPLVLGLVIVGLEVGVISRTARAGRSAKWRSYRRASSPSL